MKFVKSEGKTTDLFGKKDFEESFIYIISGMVEVSIDGKQYEMTDGGYGYAPAGVGIGFLNKGESAKILLYKQRYIPLEGHKAYVVTGNVNDIEFQIYDEMENVFIKSLYSTERRIMQMRLLAKSKPYCLQ